MHAARQWQNDIHVTDILNICQLYSFVMGELHIVNRSVLQAVDIIISKQDFFSNRLTATSNRVPNFSTILKWCISYIVTHSVRFQLPSYQNDDESGCLFYKDLHLHFCHSPTGQSEVVAFATWGAYFEVILGQVAYKTEWEKAKKANVYKLCHQMKRPL